MRLLQTFLNVGFMPHGHCYLWTPSMVWTQVTSNLLIGLAYASIASTLAVLVRRVKDIPFAWVYVAFGVFILSCGLTHWFDVVTVWQPIYWADAAVRVITAAASVATAILILPLVPKAVALAEAARLSDERGRKLEAAVADLEVAHHRLASREQEAQERAESSEEQFRLLVETMPQLAWITDPAGRNLYRNTRWTEYTGLALEEIERGGWASVHDPSLIDTVLNRWKEALSTGDSFEAECRLRGADGEYRWFLARALALRNKAGVITAWMGTCTDIHDERRLRDEALHAAKIKDEFLATVSHELRTPLNAMLGWSRMLRSSDIAPEKRDKGLQSIERNAVAQAQLIDDLLDVSRIISGKMKVDVLPMNPVQAVDAALDTVKPMATAKGVQLVDDLERDPGLVMGDAARLQQVIWNLAANAVKFTPKGGTVRVSLRRAAAAVEIVVADTGSGIHGTFLPHVFDRFTQSDSSIRRKQGGLGLGLAIAKHLTELHGGHIRAESRGEGQGASFTVTLPLASAQTRSNEAVYAGDPPRDVDDESFDELRGLGLLIVEDDTDSREMYAALLSDCGVRVIEARTAEEGLRKLAAERIDVIVSDIGLPELDGYEFIRHVRRMPETAGVPAAALTAYARADDRDRALEAGFQMHIPKPVEPSELIEVVASLARLAAATQPRN